MQSWVNACAASQYRWLVKIFSFWHYLACLWNRMLQTRPDFVFVLGFYHNFNITSPRKVSCKFFTMLSKMQRIFITERRWAIHLLSIGRSSCPYVRTNHEIFTRIFQWQICFCWDMALTKPGCNPIGFFPIGPFKKIKFLPLLQPSSKSYSDVLPWKFRTFLRKCCEMFSKIWCAALLRVKISMECIFSICYSY